MFVISFFHPEEKILAQFNLSLESNAAGSGTKEGLITYTPDAFTFIVTRMRFNYVDKADIENVLLTAKRQQAEIDIFTDLKLGAIGSPIKKVEPWQDLMFAGKKTFIELSNTQNLFINAKTPISLAAKDITLTLFGYKLRKG